MELSIDKEHFANTAQTFINKQKKLKLPSDSVVGTSTKPRGVVVETAVKYRTSVHELASQSIGTGIVQPNALTTKETSSSKTEI